MKRTRVALGFVFTVAVLGSCSSDAPPPVQYPTCRIGNFITVISEVPGYLCITGTLVGRDGTAESSAHYHGMLFFDSSAANNTRKTDVDAVDPPHGKRLRLRFASTGAEFEQYKAEVARRDGALAPVASEQAVSSIKKTLANHSATDSDVTVIGATVRSSYMQSGGASNYPEISPTKDVFEVVVDTDGNLPVTIRVGAAVAVELSSGKGK